MQPHRPPKPAALPPAGCGGGAASGSAHSSWLCAAAGVSRHNHPAVQPCWGARTGSGLWWGGRQAHRGQCRAGGVADSLYKLDCPPWCPTSTLSKMPPGRLVSTQVGSCRWRGTGRWGGRDCFGTGLDAGAARCVCVSLAASWYVSLGGHHSQYLMCRQRRNGGWRF